MTEIIKKPCDLCVKKNCPYKNPLNKENCEAFKVYSENLLHRLLEALEHSRNKCRFNLKENHETNSIYCTKIEQWISSKLCGICRFHEKPIMHQQKHPIDNNNYNYNISASTREGERVGLIVLCKIHYWFFGGFLKCLLPSL